MSDEDKASRESLAREEYIGLTAEMHALLQGDASRDLDVDPSDRPTLPTDRAFAEAVLDLG